VGKPYTTMALPTTVLRREISAGNTINRGTWSEKLVYNKQQADSGPFRQG